MSTFTQISNATKHVMKVQVGSVRYASELATIEAGGTFALGVDPNATYQEFTVGVDAAGMAKVIVSSDDLCDNKCITIKEENGKLTVQMEPRKSDSATINMPHQSSRKESKWLPAWMSK